MEEEFNKLKKQMKNSVDHLIKWMQDCIPAKIVETAKPSEDNVRKLFSDVQDIANVEFTKFQEVVGKLAAEQKKTLEELSKSLAAEASKVVSAATSATQAGANAASTTFKREMKK